MKPFNFTTNIEKRVSTTGEVVCIDRMTSDYAERHPLDVDGFIESVYQEFAGTEFEESRETLHKVWTATMSMTEHGDKTVYPNNNGARRAAAMKVWHKAGDYWRMGLRLDDTLPDLAPMCKITRLDDGAWIALFPKDAHLIENGATEETNTDYTDDTDNIEPARNQSEPKQLDLFAFERQQRRPIPRRCQQPQAVAAAVEPENDHAWLKMAGYVAAASIALVVVWQTGLIIPLGLIGLATSGFLK